jgi:hypothetical protein
MTVTWTENLQIATVSCRVGMLSVSFVPEVSVLEIGAQFMAFSPGMRCIDNFLFSYRRPPCYSHSQHTDSSWRASAQQNDERIQACGIDRNFGDAA